MAITSEVILRALNNSNNAVVKGILYLYEKQEEDERDSKDTVYDNERGFRVNHAKRGSELAEKALKGEEWTIEETSEAREICKSYAKTQLLDYARAIHCR